MTSLSESYFHKTLSSVLPVETFHVFQGPLTKRGPAQVLIVPRQDEYDLRIPGMPFQSPPLAAHLGFPTQSEEQILSTLRYSAGLLLEAAVAALKNAFSYCPAGHIPLFAFIPGLFHCCSSHAPVSAMRYDLRSAFYMFPVPEDLGPLIQTYMSEKDLALFVLRDIQLMLFYLADNMSPFLMGQPAVVYSEDDEFERLSSMVLEALSEDLVPDPVLLFTKQEARKYFQPCS